MGGNVTAESIFLDGLIYTTIGVLSSKFEEFLAGGRNSTAIITKFGRHVRIDLGMVPT